MRGKAPGDVRDDKDLMLKLVWCPPGFLTRWKSIERTTESAAKKDDGPSGGDSQDKPSVKSRQKRQIVPVKVFVTQGYWLGQYEVTQSEWKQVMKTEPWKDDRFVRRDRHVKKEGAGRPVTLVMDVKEGADFPATFVSWDDAIDFCCKLTEQERQAERLSKDWEYTLPTEAQWEHACRARTTARFSFGDDESKLGDYAWFDNTLDAGEPYAHKVGQKKANPWGFFDIHGNVTEWCRDIYTAKPPGGRDPVVKPDEKTKGSNRVMRGGDWTLDAHNCRSASRYGSPPSFRGFNRGFRVALSTVQ